MASKPYPEEYADHLATWGSHCGAPKSVYKGHLDILIAAAVAVEREACARKAEGWGNIARNRNYHGEFTAEQIAAAIRARGGK